MKNHHKVIEWHEGEKVMIHWIPRVNVGEKGFYVTTTSFSAFRDRNAKRLFNAHQKGVRELPVRFQVCWRWPDGELDELAPPAILCEKYGINPEDLEPDIVKVHIGGVFDFYRDIGYDWKRDKLPTLEKRREDIKR